MPERVTRVSIHTYFFSSHIFQGHKEKELFVEDSPSQDVIKITFQRFLSNKSLTISWGQKNYKVGYRCINCLIFVNILHVNVQKIFKRRK